MAWSPDKEARRYTADDLVQRGVSPDVAKTLTDMRAAKTNFRPYLRAAAAVAAGAIVIVAVAILIASDSKAAAAGTAGVVGIAAFMAVGILGLIFAIPRAVSSPDSGNYAANTNLEQISDWL